MRWIRRPLGAVAVAMAVVLSTAAIVSTNGGGAPTPTPTPTPTPVTCNQTLTTRAQLVTALGTTGSSGQTICVTANITGASITGVSTDMTTQARFIAQPANGTIDLVPITFSGAHKITVEGFELTTDGFTVANGSNSGDLSILKNYVHDFIGNGVYMPGGAVANSNIKITGNYFKCVAYSSGAGGPSGYGIYNDSDLSVSTITYNTIDGCSASADGMQISTVNDSDISYNVVHGVRWNGVGSDPHADAIMIWTNCNVGDPESSRDTYTGNRIYDSSDVLFSPCGTDQTYTNNLMVNMNGGNSCFDAHPNGTSGTVYPLRHTWRQNTIWTCGATGIILDGGTGARNGNVLDRNLLQGVGCPATNAIFSSIDHNLFGTSNTCSFSGTNTYSFTPTWLDTSDPTSANYYIASNRPGGYSDAGYSYAPAGHLAAP